MRKKWLKEEKGAALAWTLILFVVMTILATSIMFIVQQDLREVVMQEKRIKTFYIAQSGVELSYAALMQNENEYFNKMVNDTVVSMVDEIDVYDGETVVGKAAVTVTPEMIDGKKWIKIVSIGTLTGETMTVRTVMRIDSTNIMNVIMERS